jgi:hypothetical protein
MAIATYRDEATGKIYDASGNHIKSLPDYQAGVRTGKYAPVVNTSTNAVFEMKKSWGQPVPTALDIPLYDWRGQSSNPALAKTPTPVPSGSGSVGGGVGVGGGAASVIRNSDGSISQATNPIDDWKNQTGFMETIKDIIKKKQGYNQDLQGSRDYWRTVMRDTSPFGGVRDPQIYGAMDASGTTFTDQDLRLLSPADQASLRASRGAAAQAHLQGMDEEAKYRETQTSDILTIMSDYYKERMDALDRAKKDASDAEAAKLDRERFEWEKKAKAIDQQIAASKGDGSTSDDEFNKDIILGQNDLKKGSTWGQIWNRLYNKYSSSDSAQNQALGKTLDQLLDKQTWYKQGAYASYQDVTKNPEFNIVPQ